MEFLSMGPEGDNPYLSDHWREGGNVPHWDGKNVPQFITFNEHGAIPKDIIEVWREKGDQLKEVDKNIFLSRRINAYLDRGNSQCWLNNSDVAELVEESIQFFHEDRYQLLAWVVMPNHVHVLLVLKNDASLDQILHSWKSYSAQKANRILGREGPFWQEEYWDRYIRNEEHLATVYNYILDNPVHANLVDQREQWEWSGNQEEL